MVIVMTASAGPADIQRVLARLKDHGCRGELTVGVERTIITVVGPRPPALQDDVRVLPQVESVVLLGKSYKLASRESKPEGTVVALNGARLGQGSVVLVGGPGCVESREQLLPLAATLRALGVSLISGGAMRPDQSPYAFRGLGERGLQLLAEAREQTGLPVASEVPTAHDVPTVAAYVDVLEIGPSNMSNFGLLEAAAATGKPIILHRAFSATLDDWLLSAEHILYTGNDRVILCESGIRTYEPSTTTTADLSAVPLLKRLTHLPVIVDPARSAGQAALVAPLALAAVAAGADGVLLEIHPTPDQALVDGAQSLSPAQVEALLVPLQRLATALGRPLARP